MVYILAYQHARPRYMAMIAYRLERRPCVVEVVHEPFNDAIGGTEDALEEDTTGEQEEAEFAICR